MARPGKMDRRVIIEARTLTQDGTGTRVETWATSATVWAELAKDDGKQIEAADGDRTATMKHFRIRYRTLSETTNRISYGGKAYEIKGIEEEGRQDTLLVTTQAIESIS